MACRIYCNNQGCNKESEPGLDKATNKVYCGECDQEISNITHFTIQTLKTLKQYRKTVTKESYSIKCTDCSKEARPQLINNKLYCKHCQVEMKISLPVANLLKQNLKNILKEEEQDKILDLKEKSIKNQP